MAEPAINTHTLYAHYARQLKAANEELQNLKKYLDPTSPNYLPTYIQNLQKLEQTATVIQKLTIAQSNLTQYQQRETAARAAVAEFLPLLQGLQAGKDFWGAPDAKQNEYMHILDEETCQSAWEAAELSDHYVNGDGQSIEINNDVYKTSKIVQDVMSAMKLFVAEKIGNTTTPFLLINNQSDLISKPYYASLIDTSGRNQMKEGCIRSKEGYVVMAEQENFRLKNADNRFYLKSESVRIQDGFIKTIWSVESKWDFHPFDQTSVDMTEQDFRNITNLPVGDFILKLPDGLSQYMTTVNVGVAKEFVYGAKWEEYWEVK